jgi:hypothetical protein
MTTPIEDKNVQALRSIPFFRDAVVALIAGLAVVLGQQVAKGPNQLTAEAAYIEQLQLRLSTLENRVAEYAAVNTSQQIELAALRASMDGELNFQEMLCSILEAQPGLNWAKVVVNGESDRPEFRMACIDAEYRATFRISAFQYIGQTDFDIWDVDTANGFYSNDLGVYTTRSPIMVHESWPSRQPGQEGLMVEGRLTKFYFSYGGSEYIIGHFPGERYIVQAAVNSPTQ